MSEQGGAALSEYLVSIGVVDYSGLGFLSENKIEKQFASVSTFPQVWGTECSQLTEIAVTRAEITKPPSEAAGDQLSGGGAAVGPGAGASAAACRDLIRGWHTGLEGSLSHSVPTQRGPLRPRALEVMPSSF